MHGGMLLAAVGAASLDNFAAALLVAVAMGLALGGLGIMITSLEERVGPVSFQGPGGRAGSLPKLATAFALFGGAGVGLPGTAGFVADDLLLHTLVDGEPDQHGDRHPVERAPGGDDPDRVLPRVSRAHGARRWRPTSIRANAWWW